MIRKSAIWPSPIWGEASAKLKMKRSSVGLVSLTAFVRPTCHSWGKIDTYCCRRVMIPSTVSDTWVIPKQSARLAHWIGMHAWNKRQSRRTTGIFPTLPLMPALSNPHADDGKIWFSGLRVRFGAANWLRHWTAPVVLIVAVAGVLACYGLNNNVFWDDEANTALFGRNILSTGKLTAWDGTNVIGFRQGAELDSQLVNVYMPPVQYYVAALGFKLLGFTTLGGRVPFLLAGLGWFAALVCF